MDIPQDILINLCIWRLEQDKLIKSKIGEIYLSESDIAKIRFDCNCLEFKICCDLSKFLNIKGT